MVPGVLTGGGSAGRSWGSGGGSRGNLLVLEECLKRGMFPEELAEIFRPAAGLLWVWQGGCAEGSGVSQTSGSLLKVPLWLLEVFISTLSRFRCVEVGDVWRCSRRTCWSFRGGSLCSDLIISEGTRQILEEVCVHQIKSSRSTSGCRKLQPFTCLD